MLIITISFLILTAVLVTTVNDYAKDEKAESLVKVAETIQNYMEMTYERYPSAFTSEEAFNKFIENNKLTLESIVYALDSYTEDIDTFITDAAGNVILYNRHIAQNNPPSPEIKKIPADIILSISREGSFSGRWSTESGDYLVYALPLEATNGMIRGILFVCSSNFTLPGLNESMVRTITMSCLWILLATMIAVYFISERITSPLKGMSRAAKSFAQICKESPMPLVADIHFDYKLAIAAAEAGASKIRINPGNIGGEDRVAAVVSACKEKNIPIRIGVNGGSLDKKLLEKYGHPTAEALVESAFEHLELLEKFGFYNTCVSMKSSTVPTMVAAARLFRQQCDYPLHIGVTETGPVRMGLMKSAMGIGALLLDGIGDTIRVSLTDDPVEEVYAAKDILKAAGLRARA